MTKKAISFPRQQKKWINLRGERVVYVGCIHGGDEDFFTRLEGLEQDPPDLLILTGDIIGSPEMERLKALFYNHVTNRSKKELGLGSGRDLSDEEIVSYVGPKPPKEGQTLKDGYLDLLDYQLALEDLTREQIDQKKNQLSDQQIAKEIRRLSEFPYFGEWAATLPVAARENMLGAVRESVDRLIRILKVIQEKGARLVFMGGNWESPTEGGTAVISGSDLEPIDAKPIFERNGIPFCDSLATIETASTLHILLPYYALRDFEETPSEVLEQVRISYIKSRALGKTVVLVGHAEANAEIHGFSEETILSGPESRRKSIAGFVKAIMLFTPDRIIYSHQHDRIDYPGVLVAESTFRLALAADGHKTELVRGSGEGILTFYLPLRSFRSVIY